MSTNTLVSAGTTLAELDVTGTAADSIDTAGGIQTGSGNVALINTAGKITALSGTEVADLSGAALTTLNASNVSSGTLANARLPTNVDLGGTLDVTGATTLDSTLGVVGAVTFNDAGNDVDFRIESDGNANIIFVNGGTNQVGIGAGTFHQAIEKLAVNGVIVSQEDHEYATPTIQTNKTSGVYIGGQSSTEARVAALSLTDDIAGASRNWSLVNGRTDSAQTIGTLNFLAADAQSQDPLDGAVTVMSLDDNGDVDITGKMTAPQYYSGVSAALAVDATTNLYASSGASGSNGGMIAVRDGYSRFALFWYGSYDTLTKLAGNSVFTHTKDNASTINIYYESGNIVYQNKTAVASLAVHYTRILD